MRSPAPAGGGLSPSQRATLAAAARRIVPHAFEAGPHARADLVDALDAQVAALAPAKGADLRLALDLFGHALAALATVGRARRFAALSCESQDRMLEAWGRSRVAVQRTAMQAMRRLVLATYYGLPEGQAVAGYLGPFHRRTPAYAWEGPLQPGAHDADGPVAVADPATPAVRAGGGPPEHHDTTPPTLDQHPRIALRGEPSPPELPAGVETGQTLRADARLTADVVVIGTGAGGGVAAARLAEAGLSVVVLERGGYYAAAQFTEREVEMHERLYAERGLRATDDLSTSILQGECVGGGTTVNWLIMLRTPDRVLDEWARRFGAEGMTPPDLAPVFDLVEEEVHARPVPDEAHSPNNRIVLDGARALGWSARAGRVNARGCVRSGFCGQGCRYDAKQGTLVTYLPRALRAGARLFADADVQRVEMDGRGAGGRAGKLPRKQVTAHVRDRETGTARELVVEAPVVVLAAGAVGTPVLLQRSGLGTGGGVGRYLRLHPTTAVVGAYERDIYGASGIPLSAVCDEFADRDGAGYGYWIECPPLHPALAAAALPGFGGEHRRLMAQFPRLGSLIALVRDGADVDASNGSVTVDRAGRTRIRYRLGTADRAHMIEAMESAARLHLACGAREVLTLHTRPVRARGERDLAEIRRRPHAPNDFAMFSAHVNGTCRLGVDPRTSGALPTGEVHGAAGLYVCDGSLLPTAPGVNPQETIMAVATVVAAGIAARFG